MKVLVTGAAGYIGSHACVALLDRGHEVVAVDDYSTGHREAIWRIEALTGRSLTTVEVDLRHRVAVDEVFATHHPDAVIHFAGRKFVGESVELPWLYYDVNVVGSVNLVDAMRRHDVRRLVFSSSCTVYGDPAVVPVDEDAPVAPVSPYGTTKATVERLLADTCAAWPEFSATALRYFNPIGAHPSGQLGEDAGQRPNNLLPYLMLVANGQQADVQIFGHDYPTPDGTCLRDYLHVVDLAAAHVAALDRPAGCTTLNLGTGRPVSVLEMVRTVEEVTGQPVPYRLVDRRPGDAAVVYARPERAEAELGWRAERTLAEMVADHWRWWVTNPAGYTVTVGCP